MHESVTTSTTLKNLLPPNDLLAPIKLQSSTDGIRWPQVTEDDSEPSKDIWQSSPSTTIASPRSRRPAAASALRKLVLPPMPTHSDSNFSNDEVRVADQSAPRWPISIDSENNPVWNIAEDMKKLDINEAKNEDVHDQLRTPPHSKHSGAALAQLGESSPLESSSSTSVGSSPHPDHQLSLSHSRGPSTDSSSSQDSSASNPGNKLLAGPLKVDTSEAKDRSNAYTASELLRSQQDAETVSLLGQQQWNQGQTHSQYRDVLGNVDKPYAQDQLSYPSLASVHRPQPQASNALPQSVNRDEALDYNRFGGVPPLAQPFLTNRPNNTVPYRQAPRNFPQQGLIPSPTALGYPSTHTSHLSLGNQQLYDMMLAGPENHPAVNRVQQQHNLYRTAHHHSASDPTTLRDAAALALLAGTMPAFAPSLFQPGLPPPPTIPLYAGQFYGTQELYGRPDVAAMAARLQSQFTGPYGVVPPAGIPVEPISTPAPAPPGQSGPSANNRKLGLYKTELCRSWEEKGSCRYGTKCQFAHGEEELRKVARHPKYKTEICRTFWVSGSCPYGKRCCFIHTEVPAGGSTAGAVVPTNTDAAPTPRQDGRARSASTNSDPNDASTSLLARISAKRTQENNATTPTPVDSSSVSFSRPTMSLRVDTALDGASIKQQNKSAYPTFTNTGIMLPAPESRSNKSPGPVTAGPDLGRHNEARLAIVGYNNRAASKVGAPSTRHSLGGPETESSFPTPTTTSYALSATEAASRVGGHSRAGSTGNWSNLARNNHLSAFPHSSSPAGDMMANSPWSTTDLVVGSSRLNEKPWA